MPDSMAACRTVLPLATVTGRPSIVSVTVSIDDRSYQEGVAGCGRGLRPFLDHLGQSAVVFTDLDAAQDAFEPHPMFNGPLRYRYHHVNRFSVGILQRYGDRHVEELAGLLD